MKNIVRLASVLTLLPVAAGIAGAQTANTMAEAAAASSALSPVDYNFVALPTSAPLFQIDPGRIAEKKATNASIRDYAHLMVVSHEPVVEALNTVLQQKHVAASPNTLLEWRLRDYDDCVC